MTEWQDCSYDSSPEQLTFNETITRIFYGVSNAFGKTTFAELKYQESLKNGVVYNHSPVLGIVDELKTLTGAFASIDQSIRAAEKAIDDKKKGQGRITNHGPRNKPLYDKRGRRRW